MRCNARYSRHCQSQTGEYQDRLSNVRRLLFSVTTGLVQMMNDQSAMWPSSQRNQCIYRRTAGQRTSHSPPVSDGPPGLRFVTLFMTNYTRLSVGGPTKRSHDAYEETLRPLCICRYCPLSAAWWDSRRFGLHDSSYERASGGNLDRRLRHRCSQRHRRLLQQCFRNARFPVLDGDS